MKRIKPQFDYGDQYALEGHFPQEELAPVEVDPLTSTMESMERKPSSAMDSKSAALIADIGAASLPAVSALLGRASPRTITDQFNYANNYAKTRGQGLVPSKQNLTTLEGPDGEPYYELAEESLGEKPYYQPRSSGAGGGQTRQFQPITLKNIDTGEVVGAIQNANGYFNPEGQQYDMTRWLPFKTDDLLKEKTVTGGSTITARDKYTGAKKPVSARSGLGDYYGGIPKEEAVSGIKAGEKAKASSQKALEAANGADRAYAILSRPNLSPELAAQGIFAIIKANNGERLSDSDYAQARGDEFKSYLRQAEEWASGKIKGDISPRIIAAYAEAAKLMADSKRREVGVIKKSYVPEGMLPQSGQQRVERASGIPDEDDRRNSKDKYKNYLKGIK